MRTGIGIACLAASLVAAGCGSGSSGPGNTPSGGQVVSTPASLVGLSGAEGDIVLYKTAPGGGHIPTLHYRVRNAATGLDFELSNGPLIDTSFAVTADWVYGPGGTGCQRTQCIARWRTDNTMVQVLDSNDAQLAGTQSSGPIAKGRYVLWNNFGGAVKSLSLFDTQTSAQRIIVSPTAGHDVWQYDFTVSGGVPVVYFWSMASASALPRDLRLSRWTEADGVTTVLDTQATPATATTWQTFGPSVRADGDEVAYHLIDTAPGSPTGFTLQKRPVTLAGSATQMAPQAGGFQFRGGALAWQDFTNGSQFLKTWTQARGETTLGAAPILNAFTLSTGAGYVAYKLDPNAEMFTWQASTGLATRREGNPARSPILTAGRIYYLIGGTIYRQTL